MSIKDEKPRLQKISYSAKNTYEWCGRQYRFIYVDRAKPDSPKHIAVTVGSAIHSIINKLYIEKRFDLPYAISLWSRCFSDTIEKDKYIFRNAAERTSWFALGQEILTQLYRIAEREGLLVEPIATEWRFKLPLNDKVLLVGVVDLIIKVGEEIYIIDFKTGSSQLSQREVNEDDQLILYSLAVRKILNLQENRIGLLYARHNKIKWMERLPTQEDYNKIINKLIEIGEKIERKEFLPTYVRCFQCSYSGRCIAEDLSNQTGLDTKWFFSEMI